MMYSRKVPKKTRSNDVLDDGNVFTVSVHFQILQSALDEIVIIMDRDGIILPLVTTHDSFIDEGVNKSIAVKMLIQKMFKWDICCLYLYMSSSLANPSHS